MKIKLIILIIIYLFVSINAQEVQRTADNSTVIKLKAGDGPFSKKIIEPGAIVTLYSPNGDFSFLDVGEIELMEGGKFYKIVGVMEEDELVVDVDKQLANKIAKSEIAEVEIAEITAALPKEFTIERAYPNPFNPVVNIRYGLPAVSSVHLVIHDLSGRLINEYAVGDKSAGWHEFKWDATDKLGQSVGSGIYLLNVQVGDKHLKQKLTFIK